MPIYQYQCDNEKCRHGAEAFQHIHSDPLKTCPVCHAPGYHRVPTLVHTDLREFHQPIEMFSIAMEDLNEIREFKQKCPDVDISDDPSSEFYGIPIARHRKAKLQALNAAGYVETNSERVRG